MSYVQADVSRTALIYADVSRIALIYADVLLQPLSKPMSHVSPYLRRCLT